MADKKFAPPAGAVTKKTASAEKTVEKTEKPAKKAAPKAEKTPRAPRVVEDRKIKALVKVKDLETLVRPGSFCFAQVEAAITSKTISEAQAKLDKSKLNPAGRKLEVAWLVKKEFISVS